MKKLTILFVSVLLLIGNTMVDITAFGAEKPSVSALAAVLISEDTGEIIYSVNSGTKLPMASTTKIMTTLLCLESGDLDEEFVVDSDAVHVEGSSMGLQEGDIVTKYALCCGMLLPSGNDAANVTAVKLAGSIDAFADMMNQRAEEIGLTRTHFVTPSGLEGEGHGSSAYDMAILAREAMKNDTFRDICSSQKKKVSFGNPPYDRWLSNTNKLLSMYDGVCGVKTGFTDEAGRCLVSACERDGKRFICVTLNDKDDWNDHIAMYDYGFAEANSINIPLPESFQLQLAGDCDTDMITLYPMEKSISVTSTSANSDNMDKFNFTVVSAPFVYAPIKCGETVAELRVEYEGREVCSVPLCADRNYMTAQTDKKTEKNTFDKIIGWVRNKF